MGRLLDEDDVIDAVQQHREDVLGGYEYDEGVAFVYAAAHNHIIEVIKQLQSAQPERKISNKEWIDFLVFQFDISRTSAKEMLHGMMRWKKEDNFKKQFRGEHDE